VCEGVLGGSGRPAWSSGRGPPQALSVEVMVDCSSRTVFKQGGSGGLAIALAIVAGAFRRELYDDMVITGEISLAGVVLPVSGINPKIRGVADEENAHLMLPKENVKYYFDKDAAGHRKRFSVERHPAVRLVPVTNFLQAVDLAFAPKPGQAALWSV
jgi:predicted ATP-dependent protease